MVDALASGVSARKSMEVQVLSRAPVRLSITSFSRHRGVAQWLARSVRDAEVGGSSPLTPTNLYDSSQSYYRQH